MEQVAEAEKMGIKACALHQNQLKEHPEIVGEVLSGKFQLVFMCPEVLNINNAMFKKMVSNKGFCGRVFSIVIDEVHLCQQW